MLDLTATDWSELQRELSVFKDSILYSVIDEMLKVKIHDHVQDLANPKTPERRLFFDQGAISALEYVILLLSKDLSRKAARSSMRIVKEESRG